MDGLLLPVDGERTLEVAGLEHRLLGLDGGEDASALIGAFDLKADVARRAQSAFIGGIGSPPVRNIVDNGRAAPCDSEQDD